MAARKKHPLAHLIPDPSFHENYVSRVIDGFSDLDLLQYARDFTRNVLLFGPTGPGKTSLVLAYCALNKIPLVTLQCNGGIDTATLWGQPVMDKEGNVQFIDSEMLEGIRYGDCLIYIDEPNFATPKTMAAFQGLLDKRREVTVLEKGNERVKAGDGLLVVASYNPGYEGTRPLNQAFRNRFSMKVEFDYDNEVESQLISMPALLALAGKLRQATKDGTIFSPTSTNLLVEFEDIALELGLDFAVRNFVNSYDPAEQQAVRDMIEIDWDRIEAQLSALVTTIENG